MGVYIKGIEMPKENQRGLWVVIHSDGTVEYDTGDYGWQTLRQSAFNVPPHGDLIDRDAAYDKIAEQEGGNYVDMDAVDIGLEETPVVIPAEEEA